MKELFEDVAFVVYPVSDMKRAREFYTKTLELTETSNWEDQWIEYDIGHGTLAISAMFEQLVPGTPGAILAVEVADLDKLGQELKGKGVSWHGELFETPVCRGGSIKDPDGNVLMFHQLKNK